MRLGESRAPAPKGRCSIEHRGEPLCDFRSERADCRYERAEFRLGIADFRSVGADLRPERGDFRPVKTASKLQRF